MWGHLLPMTIVVLSHILSISPSAAAPQNFILPPTRELDIPRDERAYDNDEISTSFEDSNSNPNDQNNFPPASLPLQLQQPNSLIENAILLNSPIPDDFLFRSLTAHLDRGQDQIRINPLTPSSTFQPRMRTRPTQENGLWNLFKQDRAVDDQSPNQRTQDGGALNFWIHNQPVGARDNLPLIRNEKRSPRCLRKCLQQGLLHPSQCHSLC